MTQFLSNSKLATGAILGFGPAIASAHPGHLADPNIHVAYHAVLMLAGVGAAVFIGGKLMMRRSKDSRQQAAFAKTYAKTNAKSYAKTNDK
ncbi:MAG: hypothetical protein AAF098_10335 [Pseudomonadota bacterium]